ncbi:response regulator [bacterium]|nr:response regulator [bacterium]
MNFHTNQTIPPQRILVIDDEAVVGLSCKRILSKAGHEVDTEQSPILGLEKIRTCDYDVILLDLVMDEMSGIEVLEQCKAMGNAAEVIVITGYSTVETAVKAMKLGAADYVSKPFAPDELVMVLNKVLEHSRLVRENTELRQALMAQKEFGGMIGESRAMQQVFRLIQRVAPTEGTVLITGESGTGKEMVARAIHDLSPRQDNPFLACDCSTLAPNLLESELFGHVKGSFSGAIATKKGMFESANQGTLFLDELANISLEIQGKLLRVLESRRVKKVGDAEERPIDIRLLAATNRDLKSLAAAGEFREDLYYRLNVVPIPLPPLRERQGDIPILANRFLAQFVRNNPVDIKGFHPDTMAKLEAHTWPGNVRELKNMIERLAILCDADRIEPRHLPPEFHQAAFDSPFTSVPQSWEEVKVLKKHIREKAVRDLEHQFVVEALTRSHGNVTKAAEQVGMQRTNFHALMSKYGISGDGG